MTRRAAPTRYASHGRSLIIAAALITLVQMVGMPTPVQAQEPPVFEATYDWTQSIPVTDLNISEDEEFNPTGNCQEIEPEIDPEANRFSFAESSSERRCAYASYTFVPPIGVASVAVSFTADRSVNQAGGVPSTQSVAEQLLIFFEENNETARFAYFDSTSADAAPQFFSYPLLVDNPGREHMVRWRFEDRGPKAVAINPSVTAFSANVTTPRLHFEGIPLGPSVPQGQEINEENGTRITVTRAAIEIPDLLPTSRDSASIMIHLLTTDELIGITTPREVSLNLDTIPELSVGLQRTRILDETVLRNIGPGEYTFTFQRTETLPPPAAPPAPATIFPLVYLLSLLPAPAAAYAYTQVWRVRRASEAGASRAAGLYIGAAALTLAYAGLLGFLYVTGNLRQVATLPVGTEGVFLFTGFVVLAVAFILLGALVARSVLRALKRDLEERRQIQKELERSNQELEHFAYVASHDLQEPLRTISGFSQLLKKRYEGELDERAIRYITRTVEGTDRMSRLIHDLLEYSRVDSRGRPLEPTDLNRLVDDVKQDLETLIESSGAKVTADHLPTVQADPTQLAQVLSNLVRNSIKYRHPDRDPEVHISSSQQDGAWMIAVSDNGMGIPEDQQERAFVIFQRLVPRETDDTGTGLGLAISRKIVERHAGQIWVESDGASGSTFRFTLPRGAEPGTNGAKPKRKRKAPAPAATRK